MNIIFYLLFSYLMSLPTEKTVTAMDIKFDNSSQQNFDRSFQLILKQLDSENEYKFKQLTLKAYRLCTEQNQGLLIDHQACLRKIYGGKTLKKLFAEYQPKGFYD